MTEHESARQSTSLVHPGTEPDHRDMADDGREIVLKWNVGEPDSDGRQRQARFSVMYQKSWGYRALVTTVLATDTPGLLAGTQVTSEYYPISLMKMDEVAVIQATRFSRSSMEKAFTAALAVLQDRVDKGESAIVRHFDSSAPVPTE